MRILNISVFASASENGALILNFTKLILRIKKKAKSIVFFTKTLCQSKESPPPPLFQKMFFISLEKLFLFLRFKFIQWLFWVIYQN